MSLSYSTGASFWGRFDANSYALAVPNWISGRNWTQ
jgi:hypothetical protein